MPDYPTNADLIKIKKWPIRNLANMVSLINYIEDIWWMSEWGYKKSGKLIIRLELHTGGWSGNEEIISALKSNWFFWSVCWQKSIRGGHFYFKLPRKF